MAVIAHPQLTHYRCLGLPNVVQQLYRLGVGAAECVLCGARQHGCYDCPQRSSPNGWAMWQAWERRWLLLQAKELEIYALSVTEGEYLRRSGAVFARSVVTRAVVAQFRWPAAGQQPKTAMRAPRPASPSPQRSAPQRVVAFSPPQQRVPATSPPQARAQMPTSSSSPKDLKQRLSQTRRRRIEAERRRSGKKRAQQRPGQHPQSLPKPLPPSPLQRGKKLSHQHLRSRRPPKKEPPLQPQRLQPQQTDHRAVRSCLHRFRGGPVAVSSPCLPGRLPAKGPWRPPRPPSPWRTWR